MVIFFSRQPWPMMTFLNPLDALIPKIPFSLFAEFRVRVTSGGWGSVSVGFGRGEGASIKRLLGEGGVWPEPPPQLKACPPQQCLE